MSDGTICRCTRRRERHPRRQQDLQAASGTYVGEDPIFALWSLALASSNFSSHTSAVFRITPKECRLRYCAGWCGKWKDYKRMIPFSAVTEMVKPLRPPLAALQASYFDACSSGFRYGTSTHQLIHMCRSYPPEPWRELVRWNSQTKQILFRHVSQKPGSACYRAIWESPYPQSFSQEGTAIGRLAKILCSAFSPGKPRGQPPISSNICC